ncbi:MAG: hypothetical protein ACKVP5_07615 [Aestuariivirga sp.]
MIRGPKAASFIECSVNGQTYVAENALLSGLEKSYLKIRCTPDRGMQT